MNPALKLKSIEMCITLATACFQRTGIVLFNVFYSLVVACLLISIVLGVLFHSFSYLNVGICTVLLIIPVIIYDFMIKQLKDSLARFGWGKKLTLTSEHFSWQWENKVITTDPWQTFYCLQKRKLLWLLYFNKAVILYLPTDQLPPEAQAFILQKLTEHNVPIIS